MLQANAWHAHNGATGVKLKNINDKALIMKANPIARESIHQMKLSLRMSGKAGYLYTTLLDKTHGIRKAAFDNDLDLIDILASEITEITERLRIEEANESLPI